MKKLLLILFLVFFPLMSFSQDKKTVKEERELKELKQRIDDLNVFSSLANNYKGSKFYVETDLEDYFMMELDTVRAGFAYFKDEEDNVYKSSVVILKTLIDNNHNYYYLTEKKILILK